MDNEAAARRIVARLNVFRRRLYAYRQICAEANVTPQDDAEELLLHEWPFINVPDPGNDEAAPLAMAPVINAAPSAPTTGGRGRG